jgi:OmpA-OmpF porin, OOP family
MKTTVRFLVLLVACVPWITSQGQKTKSLLSSADKYYSSGEYYTAAYLYEQFLNPVSKPNKNGVTGFPLNSRRNTKITPREGSARTNIYFKQAESYRLANYWEKAAASYKECITKSPEQYTNALYWYAVCQRNLTEYTAAEESLKKYLSAPGLNKQFKKEAEKELLTLQYIRQQVASRDSLLSDAHKLNAPGSSEKGVFAAVQITDSLFLFSSTQKDSLTADTANPYRSRLFYASLNNDGIKEMTPVVFPGMDIMNNQGAAGISADGNYLYFSQWKKENGRTVSSIYYAAKQNGNWSSPILLPLVNMSGYNSKQPFCSSDGKYLFFSSDRPDGSGKFDIWYAPLNKDGTTGNPVNAGTVINTSGDEQTPFYHNNSTTLVFSSNGRTGMGGYDLFSAKGIDTTWQLPENMGFPINSSGNDTYFFALSKASLLGNSLFSSDRGGECCLETYRITYKTVKAPNRTLTGILRNCTSGIPVANAEIILKDAFGKKWGSVTDTNGRYVFDLVNEIRENLTLTISGKSDKETTPPVKIKNLDKSDSIDLCIADNTTDNIKDKQVIIPEDVLSVYFDFDKSVLKPITLEKLDSVYNVLVATPTALIQISGYTDGLGTEKYNKVLSDKRAKACAGYLIKKGIGTSRITFLSFGACCPVEIEIIDGQDNPEGRSLNRRALINIKKD